MVDLQAHASDSGEWAPFGPTLLRSIRRFWYWIALLAVAATVVGYLASAARSPTYEATTTVFLSNSEAFGGGTDLDRQMQQEANRLASRSVFSRASELLDGVSAATLSDDVSVAPYADAGLIEITFRDTDPARSARTVNMVTQAYEEMSRTSAERRLNSALDVLQPQVDQLSTQAERLQARVDENPSDSAAQGSLESIQAQLFGLRNRMTEMAADAALYGSGIDSIEAAVPPREPISPIPIRDAVLAGLLGTAIATTVAFWRTTVSARYEMDRSSILDAPMLAQIPEFASFGDGTSGKPLFDLEVAEAYQFLLASFEYSLARSGANSVLVTSVSPRDGKSLTALHLARALALQGRAVILVDSDVRARGLTSLLRAEGRPGLVSLAEGERLDRVVRRYQITESVDLAVIPSGPPPPNPTGLFATDAYRSAITEIVESTDLTIIDSVSLLEIADASTIAAQVSGILLVVDSHATEPDLQRVRERLRLIPTPLLGFVVNRVSEADGMSIHRAIHPVSSDFSSRGTRNLSNSERREWETGSRTS